MAVGRHLGRHFKKYVLRLQYWVDIFTVEVDEMARTKVERNISYDDKKGLFYVNMDYGTDEDGKRTKKVKTFKTIKEARTALRTFEGEKIKGDVVKPTDHTLKTWLTYWIEEVVKPNRETTTYYGYNKIIQNHLIPNIGNVNLQKLTAQTIQKYYNTIQTTKSLSNNTLHKHHDLLNTALKLAVRQEIILKNPMLGVEPPKLEKINHNYYDADQLNVLFNLIEGNILELPIKLAGYLGLRREEICGLKWESVNMVDRVIIIQHARTVAGATMVEKGTKNDSSIRTLHIPDALVGLFNQYKERQILDRKFYNGDYIDSGYVIVWEDGRPIDPKYISHHFKKFIDKHTLPKLKLHELRHTFTSVANSLGIPMYDIGKALGHSTPATTSKIYTHLFDKTHTSVFDKVAEQINPKPKE